MGRISQDKQKNVSIPLAPRDAANIYGESDRGPATIVDAYVFDGAARGMSEAEVREWVADRLRCSPILTASLRRVPGDLEYPSWVTDDTFDVDDHVRVHAADMDWTQARWIVAGLVHARMDLAAPPWDVTVLSSVSGIGQGIPDGATVVVLRFHHSIGDAVATAALAGRMFAGDEAPTVPVPAAAEAVVPAVVPAVVSALLRVPVSLARFGRALLAGVRSSRQVAGAVERGEIEPARSWPNTRFNDRLGGIPGVTVLWFDLADLDGVRSTVDGATVNDAMLTIVGGAMATYLTEAGERPDGSLGAKMPIAVQDDTDSANKFALGSVALHTDVDDPHDRLRLVRESTRAEKQRQRHTAVARQRGLSTGIPAFVTRFVGAQAGSAEGNTETISSGNTLISNVPSMAAGAHFGQAPIVAEFSALTLGDGDCLAHFVSSVEGRVSLTVTADSAALPDLDHYAELLRAQFTSLRRTSPE